jgi:hypothetical protein
MLVFTGGRSMSERITKITPPRNPTLDIQDELIQRLEAEPRTPLIAVPPDLARAIRAVATLQFGGRCTFTQILHACLSLPEFAWWTAPENAPRTPAEQFVQDMVDATTPAEDQALYRSVRPATFNPAEIPLLVTEAFRQSPEWDVLVHPPTPYGSQRLVFLRRAAHPRPPHD